MKQCPLLIPKWSPFFIEYRRKTSVGYICASGRKVPRHEPQEPKHIPDFLKCIPSTRQGWTRRDYTSPPREPYFRILQSWELLQFTFHPEHYTQFLACKSDFTVFWIDIISFTNIITWCPEKLFSQYKDILMSAFQDIGEILERGN